MNITQQGIVTLLKSAVTGQAYPLPEDFSLEAAYPNLKKHHMDALLYEGAVRCGLSKKDPVMQQLFQKYCKALLRSEGQMAQVARIGEAFEQHGIDYMPLKGCKLKALYPKQELRTMGDADILIRVEQYPQIQPIMESLGYSPVQESDHEFIWRHPQLLLELHKWLIPSYNADFYGYFGDGWALAKHETGCHYAMCPEDEFLYLFTHFAKHYRDGGIGCRYVLDLWVYLRAHPALDGAYLENGLRKLGLWEFYGNICHVMDVWFDHRQPDGMTDLITDFIFSSGSWGQAQSHALSQLVRNNTGRVGKAQYLKDQLFPSVAQLERKYPVLQKAPWLLPAVWVYRPVYKVLFERKDVAAKRDLLQKVSAEEVDAKREMLRFVGLDFS